MSIKDKQASNLPNCIDVPGLAAVLGVSLSTAWALIRERKIAHTRIGRRVLVSPVQLEEFLRRSEVPAFDAKASAQQLLRG